MSTEKQLTGYPSIDKPWLKYYSEEQIKTPLPKRTLYDHLKTCNEDNLERVALNYYGNKVSYGELIHSIDSVAESLSALGVKKGDIVTVIMVNSPETIYLMFALTKIGAVANMLYGADSSSEIRRHIVDAKSSIVFTLDVFLDKITSVFEEANLQFVVVVPITQGMSRATALAASLFKGLKTKKIPQNSHYITWRDFYSKKASLAETAHDPSAPAIITYTGGTTGGSKGVLLSNEAILAVATQYIIGERELYRESRWMQVLPLFIAYGVTCSLMIPLTVGMTLITRIPMTESIAELCTKFKPNHIMYSPVFWDAFANENKKLDLSNLIAPISGGDTLTEKTESKIDDYLERCGCPYKLMNGYGMTEVGAAVSVNYDYAFESGSVGTPFVNNIVSAFDVDTGKELPVGQEGEICIHTPSVMLGYLNNHEETANIIRKHEDGLLWVHSGDLGYISENGFIHISGRLKRYMLCLIDGVAKKVFSLDIEKILNTHPYVEKCAVVPVSVPETNQAPVAFVSLTNKESSADSPVTEIHRFAEEHLEKPYIPVHFFVIDKFPLTKVGKVDYTALEKRASELMQSL